MVMSVSFLHPIVFQDSLSVVLLRFLFCSSHSSILANLPGSEAEVDWVSKDQVSELFTTEKELGARDRRSKWLLPMLSSRRASWPKLWRGLSCISSATSAITTPNQSQQEKTSRDWGGTGSDCWKCFPEEADAASTADESYDGDFPASRYSQCVSSIIWEKWDLLFWELEREKISFVDGKSIK